ncbi:PREDICTED: uncharacterized protein LOC103336488 [Prunus mume]|uniref:Uncharacterized protein LOC103336488 n=1 Tax=Prunus mume TaxID=102107 RepID=A0ABM0PCT5_PRUMU|nr:PREDICTED: uncharacterized protein LOC103336488 [Prunus mume]
MESSTSSISVTASSNPPSKRLLFDRRYGWVIDEWKDPSEEALAGGRGMFCVLPLAKSLIKMASQSINLAANSAVKALERPDLLSPQLLQAGLNDRLYKIKSSLPKPEFNYFLLKGNLSSKAASSSSRKQTESNKS